MGKKKGNKKADDYWDEAFETDQQLKEDGETAAVLLTDNNNQIEREKSVKAAAVNDNGDGNNEVTQSAKKTNKKKKKANIVNANEQDNDQVQETPQDNNQTTILPSLSESTIDDSKSTTASTTTKKKKGGGGAAIAALQQRLAAQRAAEEEQRRLDEEERAREEEEQRILDEEDRVKEEVKRLKKEKEKAKKDQLKKEGKLLTKTQKEAQQRAQLRKEQLLRQGVRVEGLEKREEDDDQPKKKVIYDNKKKKQQQHRQQQGQVANDQQVKEPTQTIEKEERSVEGKLEELSLTTENWENESEDIKKDSIKMKESWEEESDDEDMTKTPVTNQTDSSKEMTNAKSKVVNITVPVKSQQKIQQKSDKKSNQLPPPQKGKNTKTSTVQPSVTEKKEDESESDGTNSEDEESEEEILSNRQKIEKQRKDEAAAKRVKRHQEALAARSADDLRSPICCILGHVDTGKTKLLDKIRQTNVQEGEAGGITQQIGATYFPSDAIKQKTEALREDLPLDIKVPGLLIIDTPGHESFTNLRSRGSSLCNIAILVVDVLHGLEPQTLESLNLLRQRKTPFIVALNKIDRLYDWRAQPDMPFQRTLAMQSDQVRKEYENRVEQTMLAFAEQGLNAIPYYKNKNYAKYVSLVPTSAITGEGIPDLLYLLIQLTQTRMSEKLMFVGELEATVLEVKVVEGLGTTIDVILSNGVLHEGDRIIVCGLDGVIATNIRALLTPQPMRELRIKSAYVTHKQIKAAMGIKLCANGLEKALAGARLLVVTPDDDEEDLKREVMADVEDLMSFVDKSGKGVYVQASTLGSLEALLQFLKTSSVPVSAISIGPVHKKDVMRSSVMLDRAKEFAVMLCFDVKVDKDAQDMAEEMGVKIFTANIIYHLFDAFTAYYTDLVEQKRKDAAPVAVFPCALRVIPDAIFNKRDPIIIGVDVIEGSLRIGTPLCVVDSAGEIISLGKVTSMEMNHKPLEICKRGQAGAGIAIKIECPTYEAPKMIGRHFLESDELFSKITRQSIDVLKETFRDQVSSEEWALVVRLKKKLNII